MTEKTISIRLLGPFEAASSGGQEAAFRSDSERALLAYLLMEKEQPHRRESLGAMLWPDVPEKQARNNLRVALHRMRQAIEENGQDIVTANNRELRLNEKAEIWVDVWSFTDALETVETHPHQALEECPGCLKKLIAAVDLYRGPFLQGFMLEDSQPFLEWAVLKQEWLHRQALESLSTLVDVYIQLGEYEQAEDYARRQLALEGWREKAHRQLMHILALRGERSAALAQYESCRAVLEEELGVPPSDTTEKLVASIRTGEGYSEEQQASLTDNKGESSNTRPRPIWQWVFGVAGIVLVAVLGVLGFGYIDDNSRIEEREGVFWEFEGNGDLEGWTPFNDIEPMNVSRGRLQITSTGDDPYLSVQGTFAVDAELTPKIEMRMKASDGYYAQVFFQTESEAEFVEEKSLVFPIASNDDFHTYTLDMSQIDGWQGMIRKLRLDPTDVNASIEIDYIRLESGANGDSLIASVTGVYDDFDDTAYEGSVDGKLWLDIPNPENKCIFQQNDSFLESFEVSSLEQSGCGLRIKQPLNVLGSDLGSIKAQMQLQDGHNGGSMGTVLRMGTFDDNLGIRLDCGFFADESRVTAGLVVADEQGTSGESIVYNEQIPINYNSWYEVALEVRGEIDAFVCIVNGVDVGIYTPAEGEELTSSIFTWEIGSWRETGAIATVLIDDVEIETKVR